MKTAERVQAVRGWAWMRALRERLDRFDESAAGICCSQPVVKRWRRSPGSVASCSSAEPSAWPPRFRTGTTGSTSKRRPRVYSGTSSIRWRASLRSRSTSPRRSGSSTGPAPWAVRASSSCSRSCSPCSSGGGRPTCSSTAASPSCSSSLRESRPGARITGLGVVSWLIFSDQVTTSGQKSYGPAGVVIALISFLVGFGVCLHLGAVFGRMWTEWRAERAAALDEA